MCDSNLNNGCGCQNSCNSCNSCCNNWNNWNNCCGVRPLIAPTRVCCSQGFQCMEQPVICPVECRRINRTVMVPRFYPQYYQTVVDGGFTNSFGNFGFNNFNNFNNF